MATYVIPSGSSGLPSGNTGVNPNAVHNSIPGGPAPNAGRTVIPNNIQPGQRIQVNGQWGMYTQDGLWQPMQKLYRPGSNGGMGQEYWAPVGNPQPKDPSGATVTVTTDKNGNKTYTKVGGSAANDSSGGGSTGQVGGTTPDYTGGGPGVVKYEPKPENFLPPNYQQTKDQYGNIINTIDSRPAAQSAATNLGPVVQSAGVNLGPAQQAQNVQIGPLQQAAGVNLGPAAQAAGVTIAAAPTAQAALAGPAVLANDSAVRGDLMTALGYQGGLMRGENSVAALQQARLRDQAIAQQRSMMASARPGSAAMAQRIASQNMGRIEGDMAGRLQEAQLAERNAAAQQYANLGGLIRGQDNQLSQFNAGEQNTTGRLNAQLGTQVNLGNAQNATSTNIAQGNLSGNINMSNAAEKNRVGIEQGRITSSNNQFNAGQANAGVFKQAELNQDTNKFNVGQANEGTWRQGSLDQQNNQFNTGQANDAIFKQADLTQNNNQFNASQSNDMTKANDAMKVHALELDQNLEKMYQAGKISYEEMVSGKQENGIERAAAYQRVIAAAKAGKPPEPSDLEILFGAASSVIPLLGLL